MRKFCKMCKKLFLLPYAKSQQVTCGKECQTENRRIQKINAVKAYKKRYPEKVKISKAKSRKRAAQNPKNKLRKRFEVLTYKSIKEKRDETILGILGYTRNDLYNHIESQFTDDMSWENIGEWHMDHIIPINAFNFNFYTDSEFFTCWSLGNLRPMWAKDNMSKGNKIPGVDYI